MANENNDLFYYNYPYTNTQHKHYNYYNNNNFNNRKYENNTYSKYEKNDFNKDPNQTNNNGNFYPKKYYGGKSNKKNYFNNSNSNNNTYYNGYPKKKKPFIYNLRWDGYDPFTVKNIIYRAELYIMSKYPNLAQVNTNNEGFSKRIPENSKFFIIKSFNEEDVHKAIKYSLWSSTKVGNQTLNEAFIETKDKGGHVYLFFSCNGSGRYIGVAKMISEVNEKKEFNYWTQDSKWQGLFDIEWIFIKDIPFKCFKMINIMMK